MINIAIIVCLVLDFGNNARFYPQSFSESIFQHMQHQVEEEMPSQQLEPEEMQKQTTVDKSNIRYVSRKFNSYNFTNVSFCYKLY